MIKISELIQEAPIDTYQTIGDFDKGHSFRDKRDRDLVKNPVAIEKVKNFFKNSDYDFDFYFVNKKNVRQYAERGEVSSDFIEDELGIPLESLKDGKINDNNITVFFVGNSAAEKVPLTPWTIAHRLGHAFGARGGNNYAYKAMTDWLDGQFTEILALYNVTPRLSKYSNYYSITTNDEAIRLEKFNKSKAKLYNAIGTMRSARLGQIKRYAEFYHELFAQYLNTGGVKFNRLPNHIVTGTAAYGRKETASTSKADEVNETLEMMERDFQYYAGDALSYASGRIYVM